MEIAVGMRDDRVSRRSLLSGAGASIGAMVATPMVTVTTADPPDDLVRRRVPYLELAFEADVDGGKLNAPPAVGCRNRRPTIREGRTVYLSRGSTVRRGSPLVASHEGTKIPADGGLDFRALPIEASSGGQIVTIPRTSAPGVDVRTHSAGMALDVAGETLELRQGERAEAETTVSLDAETYDDDRVSVTVEAEYHGLDDVLSHPERTVIPRTQETRAAFERIQRERSGSNGGSVTSLGSDDNAPRREVTEVPDENCYLIGTDQRRMD